MNINKIKGSLVISCLIPLGDYKINLPPRVDVRRFSDTKKQPRKLIKSEFRDYRRTVMRLTELIKNEIPGIESRGFKKDHIDHKISIWQGFKSRIPAEFIASIDNLRMIPHKDNMRKGIKSIFE